MSYKILKNGEVFSVEFESEPDYCSALNMKPESIEEKLKRERWLILLFGVWSSPDRAAIDLALEFAKKYEGRFNLGVRPFNDFSENSNWCPELSGEYGSPIWLYYENGILKRKWIGAYDFVELEAKLPLVKDNT